MVTCVGGGGALSTKINAFTQVQGQFISLIPRQNNRIYYLAGNGVTMIAPPTDYSAIINVNIVPRCYGIRTD